jgi:FtsP/CotA-like multicopper oxidase with cupredoxin domain
MANKVLILASASLLLLIVFSSSYFVLSQPGKGGGTGPLTGLCTGTRSHFLIIANITGFNESVRFGGPTNPWPVLCASQGDTVRVVVRNEDTVNAHGFAIDHYLDVGRVLAPGETFSFTFIARDRGTFTVFCNVFCPIHSFMQWGRLMVS